MVRVKYIKLLSTIIFILSLPNVVNAVDKYWIGPGILWSTGSNWSSGTIPGSMDVAIFDGSFTGVCSLDANVNVSGFDVRVGYTGTITQGVGIRMRIGASHASFKSGTFIGGANPTEDITIIGDLTISGIATSFTSTVDELDLQGDYTFSVTSTFLHNMGTVRMGAGDGGTYTGSQTFYNLICDNAPPYANSITIAAATIKSALPVNS